MRLAPKIFLVVVGLSGVASAQSAQSTKAQLIDLFDKIHARMTIHDTLAQTMQGLPDYFNNAAIHDCINEYRPARDALEVQFDVLVAGAKTDYSKAIETGDQSQLEKDVAVADAIFDSSDKISSRFRGCLSTAGVRVDVFLKGAIQIYLEQRKKIEEAQKES